jgi:hypothetical protein
MINSIIGEHSRPFLKLTPVESTFCQSFTMQAGPMTKLANRRLSLMAELLFWRINAEGDNRKGQTIFYDIDAII